MAYAWSSVTEEEAKRLLSMDEAELLVFKRENGLNQANIDRRFRELRQRFGVAVMDRNHKTHDDYLILETDDCLIISDTEFPDADMSWLQKAYNTAAEKGIKTVVWAGDLFAFDFNKMTRHETTNATKAMTLADTLTYVKDVLAWFGRQFDNQYLIGSNHDDRFNLALGGGLNVGHLLSDITYTPHDFCYIKTKEHGIIKIVHPDTYSTTPITMLHKFYNAEQGPHFNPQLPTSSLQKCHFVCAHTHITSFNYSADGAHKLISIGTMRDPKKAQYYQHAQTGLPKWTNSFAVVHKGELQLVT